jgi:hypothetical protein
MGGSGLTGGGPGSTGGAVISDMNASFGGVCRPTSLTAMPPQTIAQSPHGRRAGDRSGLDELTRLV